MGEDINYDSFGFIVIRLMHADVGYRGRRVCARARFSPTIATSASLMSDQRSASTSLPPPLSHFHSTHFVSLINFVLRPLRRLAIRHSSPSPFPPCGLPSLTIFFLYSFISRARLFPCDDPPSAGFLSSRFVTRCYT